MYTIEFIRYLLSINPTQFSPIYNCVKISTLQDLNRTRFAVFILAGFNFGIHAIFYQRLLY
jgi:hypothetical protein